MKNLSNYPPGVTGNEEEINPVDYEYKIVRDHGRYFVYNQFHSKLGNFSTRKEAQELVKSLKESDSVHGRLNMMD